MKEQPKTTPEQKEIEKGESKSEKVNWMLGGTMFGMAGSMGASYLYGLSDNLGETFSCVITFLIAGYFFWLGHLFINNKNKEINKNFKCSIYIPCAVVIVFIVLCLISKLMGK